MKRKYMIIVLMAGALELTGCSQGTSNSAKNGTTGSENTIISESDIAILDTEDMFTERDRDTEYDESECTAISLSDEETKCDSDGVKMDGQTVTITEGGTYLLTGSLSNGSVVVDTDKTEKVQLILENVSIINEEGAGICVEQADKVFITLADGSTNKIVSNSFTGNEDTNIDGAIFSREDLTLNGSGTLKITSAAHGIVSKDDLVLTGGVYQIQSEKQGLSGKESVRIADETFTITSGTDAIHSEDTDEEGKHPLLISCSLNDYPVTSLKSLLKSLTTTIDQYEQPQHPKAQKDAAHINKHAMHIVRLYYTAFDILEKGEIITHRDKEREELLAIRNGKYLREDGSYAPEFFELVDALEKRFQYDVKKTALPAKPDFGKIEELLVEINKSYLRRIV